MINSLEIILSRPHTRKVFGGKLLSTLLRL